MTVENFGRIEALLAAGTSSRCGLGVGMAVPPPESLVSAKFVPATLRHEGTRGPQSIDIALVFVRFIQYADLLRGRSVRYTVMLRYQDTDVILQASPRRPAKPLVQDC